MTRQIFLIAIMLAATATQAAQVQQPRRKMDINERRICRSSEVIGTRLGRVVRCLSQAEWDQSGRENGQVIHRMQRVAPPCMPWSRC